MRVVIPFHFKIDTNRQQGAGSRGKELETNHLYQAYREMVYGAFAWVKSSF